MKSSPDSATPKLDLFYLRLLLLLRNDREELILYWVVR
ncbi:hypothetical protein RintRC_4015 [Richelia intracellularis]|nr:hypothetical protein RintRC_4015 [Richelia intracellularis]